MIRIDQTQAVVRFYTEKVKNRPLHEEKDSYYASLNLQFLDNGDVRISGAVVAPLKKDLVQMYKMLASSGYVNCTYRHKDKDIIVVLSKYL